MGDFFSSAVGGGCGSAQKRGDKIEQESVGDTG
jgi:hypothetical protein